MRTLLVIAMLATGPLWTLTIRGQGALPAGSAQAIVVDPTNSDVVYLGTSSGVFRSTDGAKNWERIDRFPFEGRDVHALAVDPNDRCTIYAGLDANLIIRIIPQGPGVPPIIQTPNSSRLLAITRDCGETWTQDQHQPYRAILKIGVDPIRWTSFL